MSLDPSLKAEVIEMYGFGLGGRHISGALGISTATVYRWLRGAGVVVRSVNEGINLARPRMGHALGKKRPPRSPEWSAKISAAKRGVGKGITVKPRGHIEYTMGEHAQRSVHVVMMEERLGRRLKRDECVHHIDGNPANNSWDNLALLTFAAHSRLHRLQDALAGKSRARGPNGRFQQETEKPR